MSYDISIENEPCHACGHVKNFEWDGLTWNLRPMMVEAFGGEGIRGFDGMKASDVAPILERGLADMKARPDHYRTFNSPNGWGTFDGDREEDSIPFLVERFLEACKQMPNGIVRVAT